MECHIREDRHKAQLLHLLLVKDKTGQWLIDDLVQAQQNRDSCRE